jgi:hypothetical protein
MSAAKEIRYVYYHLSMTKRDYELAIADGRRFETLDGRPLATIAEVREAMREAGEVVSR